MTHRRGAQACSLHLSRSILLDLLPAMISVMIDHGIEEEWGTISFPPVE